jgi:hypothetical protein
LFTDAPLARRLYNNTMNVLSVRKEKVDRIIKFLSSASGTDKAFRCYQYASKIFIYLLIKKNGADDALAQSLKNLGSAFSDARYMFRLTHVFFVLEDIFRPGTPSHDKLIHITDRLKAWSLFAYYPLEYLYWLSSHKIIRLKNKDSFEAHTSIWSCRAWFAYVVVDIVSILYKLKMLGRKKLEVRESAAKEKRQVQLKKQKKVDEDNAVEAGLQAIKSEEEDLKLTLLAEVGDFPLALNWSLYSYPMPDIGTGIFGTISSYAWTALKLKYT